MRRTDEVLAWVQEVNAKGEELDDLCSATHPTAWSEDPDICGKAGGVERPCWQCRMGMLWLRSRGVNVASLSGASTRPSSIEP